MKVRLVEGGGWIVWCPACSSPHMFDTRWTFDGNMEAPTFRASMLVYGWKKEDGSIGHPRCHSFLTAGVWEYLDDCEHSMRGQRVPLPEWPYAHGTFGGISRMKRGLPFWVYLLWLVPNYWLHLVLHEGSHWLVAHWFGWKAKLVFLPQRVGEWIFFGHCEVLESPRVTDARKLVFYAAPVLTDVAWVSVALTVFFLLPRPWCWIALADGGYALVDLVMWITGSDGRNSKELL